MNPSTKSPSVNPIAELKKYMKPFEKTDSRASILQMVNTLVPLVLLWIGGYLLLSVSYWLALPLLIVAAGFVIRTFIIFHDCCHGSFFKNKKANDVVGTITGVLTLMPYRKWKYSHSRHHATSSNLDKRGEGDMWLLTVGEYAEASFWKRLAYRCYRNPLIMFGLGPILVFLIQSRFNRKGAKSSERNNTYLTNVLIVLLYAALIWAVGWQAFVLVQGPVMFVSGLLGIWLFYVQHQFEDSYFEHEEEWSYVQAAVEGSSYYKLPKPLQWITGNIGFHHVHHLSPKVPNYNLEKAHDASIPLQKATTITLRTSLESLKFRLWDEDTKTFTGYRGAASTVLPKTAVRPSDVLETKTAHPLLPRE
ncbi:fatty acid desaturase [Saccharibacillus sp. CPCC 101409]|uniref:fatty acid desaturase n=1 Tax=Saccharibacillus sp. CPCC 101409 TaxID=3058041 RepID=UPI0026711565|nr:fatty acid desaturase [Saccharibacillus sp. CPCC 101409]MDO3410011.1 fatty acid desaturase [Saccharibacillus sp. CPCC 101409]